MQNMTSLMLLPLVKDQTAALTIG